MNLCVAGTDIDKDCRLDEIALGAGPGAPVQQLSSALFTFLYMSQNLVELGLGYLSSIVRVFLEVVTNFIIVLGYLDKTFDKFVVYALFNINARG